MKSGISPVPAKYLMMVSFRLRPSPLNSVFVQTQSCGFHGQRVKPTLTVAVEFRQVIASAAVTIEYVASL